MKSRSADIRRLTEARLRAATPRRRGALARWIELRHEQLRYVFRTEDVEQLGLSRGAAYAALSRQEQAGRIARIGERHKLWTVVPPQYRTMGAPPVIDLLDDIMAALGEPYYIGLRAAAQQYGATHYSVMVTQVMVPNQRRPITVGRSRIRFIVNRKTAETPITGLPGSVAPVRISTPEATALDLVRYQEQSGGITSVITTLAQMQPRCSPDGMRAALEAASDVAAAQRLGYCWEFLNANRLAATVASWLEPFTLRRVPLEPGGAPNGASSEPWRVANSQPLVVDL